MSPDAFVLSRPARLSALITGLVIMLIFVIAACLTPSADGIGTHQQLGLPACPFRELTGRNCPQCGMTTSFAHLVRGRAGMAFRTHPCGPVLAVVLGFLILPWCLIAGITGRSLLIHEPGMMILWLLAVYVMFSMAVWLVRTDVLQTDRTNRWLDQYSIRQVENPGYVRQSARC